MAKLTDYLPAIMSGKETMQPVDPGKSLFEGLLEGASTAFAAVEKGNEKSAEKERARRQAEKDALDASDRGAKNISAEVILGLGTYESRTNAAVSPPDAPTEPQKLMQSPTPLNAGSPSTGAQTQPVTASALEETALASAEGDRVGQQAARLQRGVKQGRISRETYELMLESGIREAFRKYPNSKYIVLEEMKKYAVDHPIMSEYRMVKDAEERETVAESGRQEEAITHAVNNGMDPNLPRETLVRGGYRMKANATAIEQNRATYRFNVEVAGNNKKALDDANQANDDAVGKYVHGQLGVQFGATLDSFNTIIQDRTIPESRRIQFASEFINTFRPKAFSIIDRELLVAVNQHGMTQKTADEEKKRLYDQVNNIFAQFAPDNPLNVIVTNGKVLQTMKDRFQLDLHDAMPVYMQFKEAFGGDSEMVNQLVENIASDPDLVTVFTRELKGFKGLAQGDQTIRLRNVLAFMSDPKTSLRDYTPEESMRIIKDSKQLFDKGFYSMAARGNPTAQKTVLETLGKVANASIDLNAGSNTRALINATHYLANAGSLSVLNNLSAQQQEFGGLVADEMRVGVYNSFRSLQAQQDAGPHQVTFDKNNSRFVITGGPKPGRSGENLIGKLGPSKANDFAPGTSGTGPSRDTIAKANAMNRALEFLMVTNKFEDHPALKNASRAEKIDFYVNGKLPQQAKPKEGISGEQRISRLQEVWAKTAVDWRNVPKVNVENEVERTTGRRTTGDPYNTVLGYGKYGTPDKPLTQLSLKEAVDFGKNVLIPNSKADGVGRDSRGLVGSSAMGAYQITMSTIRTYAPKLFGEDWENVKFDEQTQDVLGRAIFEANKTKNLKAIWQGLSDSTEGAYADKTWEEMKEIIKKDEGTA